MIETHKTRPERTLSTGSVTKTSLTKTTRKWWILTPKAGVCVRHGARKLKKTSEL